MKRYIRSQIDITKKPENYMEVFNAPYKEFDEYEDGSYAYMWGKTITDIMKERDKNEETHGHCLRTRLLDDDEFFEYGATEQIGPSEVFNNL